MSNFKIYTPDSTGVNTYTTDITDIFVRRSDLTALTTPVDNGTELWMLGRSPTEFGPMQPRRVSSIGNWALKQSGSSGLDPNQFGGRADFIMRSNGTMFALGDNSGATLTSNTADTSYNYTSGRLWDPEEEAFPPPDSGNINYIKPFVVDAAAAGQASYIIVRYEGEDGLKSTAMLSAGEFRWLGVGYNPYASSGYTRAPTVWDPPTPGTYWKLVATNSYSGWVNSAALLSDGTLWTWGPNDYGQLGRGVGGDDTGALVGQITGGGTNWTSIAIGAYNMSAIKADGTLWSWGWGVYGGNGDNTTADRSSPVQTIAGGTDWKQVSRGFGHAMAIKTDGTLWGWGFNNSGQLGDNTYTDRASPAQTVSGGTNWKQVSCGSVFTAAVKTDGTLWAWGFNVQGDIGNNNNFPAYYASPVQVAASLGNYWNSVQACEHRYFATRYPYY